MTNKTVLSDEKIRKIADAFFTKDDDQDEGLCFARDVEKAVLQSPEIQRLQRIESVVEQVLSMIRGNDSIVMAVRLNKLIAAMEAKP